jgi:hypothetical protein
VLWACLKRIGGTNGVPRIPGLGRLFAQTELAAV